MDKNLISIQRNRIEAEKIYTPWLYDYAIVEKTLLKRKKFRLGFSADIPFRDGSDTYRDTIPHPDLILILTYSHSLTEKGLKYLLLCSDDSLSFSSLKKMGHDLSKIWNCLTQQPIGQHITKILKRHDLTETFRTLLSIDHPGLRYLHVQREINLDLRSLELVIRILIENLLVFRRDNVFSDSSVFQALQRLGPRVKAEWAAKDDKPDWQDCTFHVTP